MAAHSTAKAGMRSMKESGFRKQHILSTRNLTPPSLLATSAIITFDNQPKEIMKCLWVFFFF